MIDLTVLSAPELITPSKSSGIWIFVLVVVFLTSLIIKKTYND